MSCLKIKMARRPTGRVLPVTLHHSFSYYCLLIWASAINTQEIALSFFLKMTLHFAPVHLVIYNKLYPICKP